jgi:ankyrin
MNKNLFLTAALLFLTTSRIESFSLFYKTKANDIFKAIEKGDSALCKKCLNYPEAVKLVNSEGMSPLQSAIMYGEKDLCSLLLDAGANVNWQDSSGNTALHFVCGKHLGQKNYEKLYSKMTLSLAQDREVLMKHDRLMLEIGQLLLTSGADARLENRCKRTPLHLLVLHRDPMRNAVKEMCHHLIELGQANVNCADMLGYTPLHLAASRFQYHELCLELIQKGAALRSKDYKGNTPLHAAAIWGEVETCKLLLEHDPSPVEKNKDGNTPLHEVCKVNPGSRSDEMCSLYDSKIIPLEYVDELFNSIESLLSPIQFNNTEVVSLLCHYGSSFPLLYDLHSPNNEGVTPVHFASLYGKKDLCKILAQYGADLKAVDKRGNSALHCAVQEAIKVKLDSDSIPLVHFLLDSGLEVNSRNEKGQTPLMKAIQSRKKRNRYLLDDDKDTDQIYSSLVCCLLDRGADVNQADTKGKTPLHYAVLNESLAICKILIDRGADTNAQDKDGYTSIMNALLNKHEFIFKLLLSYEKANLSLENKNGDTVLLMAIFAEEDEPCRYLLDKGALAGGKNSHGTAPLHDATGFGNEKICRLLIKYGADVKEKNKEGETPLHIASDRGFESIGKLLLENGADVNAQNNEGFTPLHHAAYSGHLLFCKLLLKNGARSDAKARNNETPLIVSCQSGESEDVCRLLLKDDKNSRNTKDYELGGTALHHACNNNHLQLCKFLLKEGFDPNSTAKKLSCLHIAIENMSEELFDLFLEAQDDLNGADVNGLTPLHYACETGLISFVEKLLLKTKAGKIVIDIDSYSLSGKTALHCAVERNYMQVAQLLLAHGASTQYHDMYSKTPLMYAAEHKYLELCKLLASPQHTSAVQLNAVRNYLLNLVRGHKELERLFERYETAPPISTEEETSIPFGPLSDDVESESDDTHEKEEEVSTYGSL